MTERPQAKRKADLQEFGGYMSMIGENGSAASSGQSAMSRPAVVSPQEWEAAR